MNLHEYQAKKIFADYGLPVAKGVVVHSVDEGLAAIGKLETDKWVVKAQVHAGGRGKAGGVKLVDTKEELTQSIKQMIGSRLVTYQTDKDGQPVHCVLIEETCNIANELFVVKGANRGVLG